MTQPGTDPVAGPADDAARPADPAASPEGRTGPIVILIGVPGAGKTTVGTLLSQRLEAPFRDTDADVVATAGRSIPEIFIDDGEAYFRELEARAVAAALDEHSGVLALGGGAVLDPQTRARLAGRPVVWLRVGVSAAANRAGLTAPRPVLMGNMRGQLRTLMEQREPLYTQVAALIVDTDQLTAEATVTAIVDALGLRPDVAGSSNE